MDPTAIEWYEVALRLGVAGVLGGVLGLERGSSGHEAGLRTHILVSVGSALFAVASVGAFDSYQGSRASTNVNIDVTRLAAYVAPGIGFIGAGVIVKSVQRTGEPIVRGLTTAATLWVVAAVGVASGLGFWAGAVAAAVVSLLALVAVRPLSEAIESRRDSPSPGVHLEIDLDVPRSDGPSADSHDGDGAHRRSSAVLEHLDALGAVSSVTSTRTATGSRLSVSLEPEGSDRLAALVAGVMALPGVTGVEADADRPVA